MLGLSGGGCVENEEKLIASQGAVRFIIIVGQVGLGKAREEKIGCQTSLKAWMELVLMAGSNVAF